MKKFIAWVLIFVLTACLAVPAAAIGNDDYDDQINQRYEEGLRDGLADAEAGKPPQYDDFDRSYVQGYTMGYGRWEWDRGYADGKADGKADAEAGNEEKEDLPWDSDSDYDDGYCAGYVDGYWGLDDAYNYEDHIDTVLTDCGGTPGKVNVRLNETCIDFGAVWPEKRNDRVMAPARAILEALGAEVDYDLATKTVTARKDDLLLRHVVGTEFIECFPGGDMSKEPQRLEMDCPSYISGGRTMVPVRFFSEAFGLYVDWDSYYQTVVLLDTQGLIDSYADQLTVVNLLVTDAMNRYRNGTYRQIAELDADIELLDSLNGNRSLDVGGKLECLCSEKGFNAAVDLDLGDVLDLLLKEYGASYLETYEQEILALCKKLHVEMIYNAATGKLYLKSPVFDYMTGQEAWIENSFDIIPDSGLSPLEAYALQDLRVENSWYYADPIIAYDLVTARMDELVEMAGDQNFQKSGNTYTYKPNGDWLADLMEAIDEALYWNLDSYSYHRYGRGITCSLQLQVTDNGDGTCQYKGGFQYKNEEMELKLDLGRSAAGETLTASVHVRNIFKANAKLTLKTTPSTDPIQTMPPTEPVDFDELYW